MGQKPKGQRMAVKIQRSLSPAGQVLIYNHDKTLMHQMDTTPELEAMADDDLKFYAEAFYNNGELTIRRRIRDRPW